MERITRAIFTLALAHLTVSAYELKYPRKIFATYYLGNTHDYPTGWQSRVAGFEWDIRQARDARLDGFSLVLGEEEWQEENLELMYEAASKFSDFKLYITFDMNYKKNTDAERLVKIFQKFRTHDAQWRINKKSVVGSFLGQDVNFGDESPYAGWKSSFIDKIGKDLVYFMPYWPMPANDKTKVWDLFDGYHCWNAWPSEEMTEDKPVSYNDDLQFLQNAHDLGKALMSSVSPGFFKHLRRNDRNQNLIFRSEDNWHIRWGDLIENDCDFAQIISWNDFGASNAVGPPNRAASFPTGDCNSNDWYAGMDNEVFYKMLPYYVRWFKTKKQPKIWQNYIFFYHRIHAANVELEKDCAGRPNNYQFAQDVFVIHSILQKELNLEIFINNQSIGPPITLAKDISHNQVKFPNDTFGPVTIQVTQNGTVVPGSEMYPTFLKGPSQLKMYNFNFITRAIRF